MANFKDFEQFADPLKLPIFGKTYTLPPIGAKTGTRIHIMIAREKERQEAMQRNADVYAEAEKAGHEPPTPEELPEVPEDPTNSDLLGDVVDEMFEDDVPVNVIDIVARTAYYDFTLGRNAAEVYWNSGGSEKKLENYIVELTSSSTNGAGATTTKKRASTSGTKSKTKNSPGTTAAKRKSATAKSSKNGDS